MKKNVQRIVFRIAMMVVLLVPDYSVLAQLANAGLDDARELMEADPAILAQEAPLTVIGHLKGVPDEMNLKQLKSVLKGERQRWSDGTKVVIALMKSNTNVGNTTSKKLFNMSGDELNRYWLALVFQGKADAPNFFNSESELESFVSQTPGAIGIISQLSGAIKKVVIDNKKNI